MYKLNTKIRINFNFNLRSQMILSNFALIIHFIKSIKMNLKKTFMLVGCLLSLFSLKAQKQHSIFLQTSFTKKIPFSFHYEYRIYQKDALSLNVGLGVGTTNYQKVLETYTPPSTFVNTGEPLTSVIFSSILNAANTKQEKIETISITRYSTSGVMLLGNKNHSIEIGLSFCMDALTRSVNDGIKGNSFTKKSTEFLVVPSMAYRFQSDKGLSFKTGMNINKLYDNPTDPSPVFFLALGVGF